MNDAVPRRAISFDTVRKIGLALPGVEEGTAWGTPALKVGGKMFTCVPSHKSAEPDSLAVRIDFDQRDELIAAAPETYYLTYHYVDYAVVLVRLARIHLDALQDLLKASWRFMSAAKPGIRRERRPPVRGARKRAV
jgi:hypothetical protein